MEQEQTRVETTQVSNPDAEALATPEDTQEALKAIAKEKGIALDADGNVTDEPQAQPEVPQVEAEQATSDPAPQVPAVEEKSDPEVPAKFQDGEGNLDKEKLDKSTQSLKDAIGKFGRVEGVDEYRRLEKEYQKKQNEINNPKAQERLKQDNQPTSKGLAPLVRDVAQRIFDRAKDSGSPMTEGQAIAIAETQVELQTSTLEAGTAETDRRLSKVEGNEKTRQLQDLVDSHPELLTKGMPEKLDAYLNARPWLRKAPEPYKEAFFQMLGEEGRGSQVKTPNPKGKTAPPTPVSPVARVKSDGGGVRADASIEDLEAEAKRTIPGYRGE